MCHSKLTNDHCSLGYWWLSFSQGKWRLSVVLIDIQMLIKGFVFFTFHPFTSLQIFSWNSICVLSGHFLWGTFHISRISMSVSMRHEIFTLIFLLSLGRSTARLIYQECSLPMHIHCCLCSLKNVLFENSTHAYNVFDQIHSCSLSPSSSLPLSCHHFFLSTLCS